MKKLKNVIMLIAGIIMLAGCNEDQMESVSGSDVSGYGVKGVVTNGTVEIYKVSSTGERGELLTTASTNSSGEFNFSVEYKGVVEVVVSAGTYVDEATGESVEISGENELSAMIKAGSQSTVGVSALSTIAAARAKSQADQGLETAMANANSEVAAKFGISNVDVTKVIPADLSRSGSDQADKDQKQYGAIQAALSQKVKNEGMAAADLLKLVKGMAEDFEDGKMDGQSAEGALSVSLKITPAEAHAGLQTAMDAYLSSSANKSGIQSIADLGISLEDQVSGETSTEVSGSASKGIFQNGEVDIYAVGESGDRGELLQTATINADGEFQTTVDHEGIVEIVTKSGSYVDEASGETVDLGSENELSTMVHADSGKSVAVTALTTIASERARAEASQGLETAIANANQEVAEEFGLKGIDIAKNGPADLSKSSSSDSSKKAQKYGAVQAGISQRVKDKGLAPEKVLTLVEEMSKDYEDGKFDGNSAEGAINFSIDLTPKEAHEGLKTAMDNFLTSSANNSGIQASADLGLELSGQVDYQSSTEVSGSASKGIFQNGEVDIYAVGESGDRGELLQTATINADGEFQTKVDHEGIVEIVAKSGSYIDEASGEKVELGSENELSTMIDADSGKSVAVTALTTIASEKAKAEASQGLETAIANANQEVAEEFGLKGIDIAKNAPADLSKSSSSDSSKKAQKYGAVQAGISQRVKDKGLAPEKVLTLVEEMSKDYEDGKFDGNSAEGAINYSIDLTPKEAHEGLKMAMDNFLTSSANESGIQAFADLGMELAGQVDYPTK